MFIWVSRDPWGTKRSSAGGTYRGNPWSLLPRGMTIWYEFWEKGICVPTRGAAARGWGQGRGVGKEEKVVVTMWEIGVLEVSGGGTGTLGE